MQFFGGKTQKVHYSAVFGDGKIKAEKTKIKALNTEAQRRRERQNQIRKAKAGPSQLGVTPRAGGGTGLKC
jgi:hypothetical protein